MEKFVRFLKVFFDKILNNKKNKILFFTVIGLICLAILLLTIYIQFFYKYGEVDPYMLGKNTGNMKEKQEITELKNNFNSIFDNKLKNEKEEVRYTKIQTNKDIVYTAYQLANEDENFYQVDVKIPMINIDSDIIKEVNNKIKTEYYDTANIIMRKTEGNTIYNVSYTAYIFDDIFSIVIKSSLKESGKNEKVSVKTYNYNLTENKMITLEELIEKMNYSEKDVQKTINSEIKKAYGNALSIAEQYGTTYNRNLEDDMYKIENTNEFFITKDGNIYILYPYGNIELTNEIDIIIY